MFGKLYNSLLDFFVPESFTGRTELEMARVFVFTHLFGPIIASPMIIFLYAITEQINYQLLVMVIGVISFATLPAILKYSRSMVLSALLSFQGLVGISLFGTYHYGGFSSPFLPWLIVGLLLGFFYLSKRSLLVVAIFSSNIGIFLGVVMWQGGFTDIVARDSLRLLSWLSISAATIYMSWMAIYYARVIALRSEMHLEAERFRATMKELEIAREVAEKANQKRSRFFSKMSHELRTPLNAIIGYSEIMLEDAMDAPDSSEQTVKDLSRINSAGKHLMSLVSDVLNTDDEEGHKATLDIEKVQLGELVDDVAANAMPVVEKNGNQFVIECADRSATVVTDVRKLRQMMINLLGNAAKFTQNGKVTLSVSVQNHFGDERLIASVSDTGIGMDADVLPKLFQSYTQADASIAGSYGGTGIGLSITKKFAVLLGGDVTVTSKPKIGSIFQIDLPAVIAVDDDEVGEGQMDRQAA